eukprot:snap_masked-scaffold_37-processed-gene-0.23-mRNA-1 protein AED:0.41 eAED:0.50 QI:0/-1/0/1/-1/1/1/0/375
MENLRRRRTSIYSSVNNLVSTIKRAPKRTHTTSNSFQSSSPRIRNEVEISSGASSIVYSAELYLSDISTWKPVAIKKIKLQKQKLGISLNSFSALNEPTIATKRKDVQKEIHILNLATHPHILKFYTSYINSGHYHIVTELSELGDLQSLLQKQKYYEQPVNLPSSLVIYLITPLLLALEHLHKLNYCHRDLKEQNLLCFSDGSIKLSDFGTACSLEPKIIKRQLIIEKLYPIGTNEYLSPEVVLMTEKRIGTHVDIWEVGIIILYLLNGINPYFPRLIDTINIHLSTLEEFYESAKQIDITKVLIPGEEELSRRHKRLLKVVKRCLVLKPWRRIGLNEILRQKDINECINYWNDKEKLEHWKKVENLWRKVLSS